MSQQDGYFRLGAATYPLPATSANSSLYDIDRTTYYMLDFCEGILNHHLGDRWTAECNAVSRSDINQIVAMKIPYNPEPYLQTDQLKLPLLAVYRTRWSKVEEKNISTHHVFSELEIMWICKPLTAAESERLVPFQQGIAAVLTDRNEIGYDPNYNSGQRVGTLSGFEELTTNSAEFGLFTDADSNLAIPVVKLNISIREKKEPVVGEYQSFAGVDVQEYLEDDQTATSIDLVDYNTDV